MQPASITDRNHTQNEHRIFVPSAISTAQQQSITRNFQAERENASLRASFRMSFSAVLAGKK